MLYFSIRFKECQAEWLACGVLISPSLKKVWTPLGYRVHQQFFGGKNLNYLLGDTFCFLSFGHVIQLIQSNVTETFNPHVNSLLLWHLNILPILLRKLYPDFLIRAHWHQHDTDTSHAATHTSKVAAQLPDETWEVNRSTAVVCGTLQKRETTRNSGKFSGVYNLRHGALQGWKFSSEPWEKWEDFVGFSNEEAQLGYRQLPNVGRTYNFWGCSPDLFMLA